MALRRARAFLFGWKPEIFPETGWIDELVSRGSGDDHWNSGSGQPRAGDWAFAVKLGKQGRGIFGRGRITGIRKNRAAKAKPSWKVRMHWDEFLDPSEVENLLALPQAAGGTPQKWEAQSNGTEVKHFPVDELHRLWEMHVSLRRGNGKLVERVFPLRADLDVSLKLPPDLTAIEAERLGAFIKTLVIPVNTQPQETRAPLPASAPGLGPSTRRPSGRRHALPASVKLRGTLTGKPSIGIRVGSGAGHVDVGIQLDGGPEATTIELPAGLVMISKSTNVQNGLLVQDVRIVVPAKEETRWILAMYCANHQRRPADEEAEFSFGPVVDDPAFHDLFEVLKGRRIDEGATGTVQQAVWEITDHGGLTPETRTALTTLPTT